MEGGGGGRKEGVTTPRVGHDPRHHETLLRWPRVAADRRSPTGVVTPGSRPQRWVATPRWSRVVPGRRRPRSPTGVATPSPNQMAFLIFKTKNHQGIFFLECFGFVLVSFLFFSFLPCGELVWFLFRIFFSFRVANCWGKPRHRRRAARVSPLSRPISGRQSSHAPPPGPQVDLESTRQSTSKSTRQRRRTDFEVA